MLLASARESCAPGGRPSSVICTAQVGQEPQGTDQAFLEMARNVTCGGTSRKRLSGHEKEHNVMEEQQTGRSEKRTPGWLVPALLVAVGVVVYAAVGRMQQTSEGVVDAGSRSGDTRLVMNDLDGGRFDLAEHRGKVVLVNLFATWCPPCRAETPDLVALARDYESKGVVVVGVSLDTEGPDVVRRFVREYGIPYPVLMPSGDSETSFQINGIPIPTTYLLDREGRIAKKYVGKVSGSVFRSDVDALLAEG
ncbi:MAG: hypothetical protein KatS3mg024_1998 [Armatimonadota bacterium]|nr:MAG: hypothetical protein KatS3mg024_1998 [Armatimonadota bacterium]